MNYLSRINRNIDGGGGYSLADITAGDDTEAVKDLPIVETPTPEPKEEPIAPEIKDEPLIDGSIKDEPEGATLGDEDDAESFFSDVIQAGGLEVDVDYGDIDPLSPQGIVLRENAIVESTINDMNQQLAEKYPKQYAYFLHAQAGKSDEEFFDKTKSIPDVPTEEEVTMSIELQRKISEDFYISQGTNKKYAEILVKSMEENGELEENSLKIREHLSNNQRQALENITKEAEAVETEKVQAISNMQKFVSNVVKEGKVGKLQIDQKDAASFASEFTKNIRYDNGKFLLVTELTDENITKVFEKEFFGFKQGNLKALVVAEAKTQNVKRLKRTIQTNKMPTDTSERGKTHYTLGEISAGE